MNAYFWIYILMPCLAGLLAGILGKFHFKYLLEQPISHSDIDDKVLPAGERNHSQEEELFKE